MSVRLPRIQWAKGQIEKERRWQPKIAPHLPLAVPVQLASGSPADGYPWEWGVYRWLAGEHLLLDDVADPLEAARTLARFITALQQIDITDAPLAAEHRDYSARRWHRKTDRPVTRSRSWKGSTTSAPCSTCGTRRFAHPNGTARRCGSTATCCREISSSSRGRQRAVIDFSGLGAGDPACDLGSRSRARGVAGRAVHPVLLGHQSSRRRPCPALPRSRPRRSRGVANEQTRRTKKRGSPCAVPGGRGWARRRDTPRGKQHSDPGEVFPDPCRRHAIAQRSATSRKSSAPGCP
jgi:hypothetical protein